LEVVEEEEEVNIKKKETGGKKGMGGEGEI
jgi:hypothetical protein